MDIPRPPFTGNTKSTPRHPDTVACLLCEVDWQGLQLSCWLCEKPGTLVEFLDRPIRELFGLNNAAVWNPALEGIRV